ncbi:MAG: response regulator transcription factor [Chloroflexi bacterium]|nr:response regulator transcription factor [Chloroflexota bacterium]
MTRVLVADDHPVVRQGIKQVLAETPDIIVAGEVSDAQGVLDQATKNDYDVVLLDISMPGGGGLDILGKLKSLKPRLPVLVLSMHPEEQYAVRALKLGAAGYLTKESAPDELVAAIRKVSTGHKYVSSSLAEKLALQLETDVQKLPHETLSHREYQVMVLVASGKTMKEVAAELALSIKTVSTYRSRILEKMRMSNNAQLISYAIRNSLVR